MKTNAQMESVTIRNRKEFKNIIFSVNLFELSCHNTTISKLHISQEIFR